MKQPTNTPVWKRLAAVALGACVLLMASILMPQGRGGVASYLVEPVLASATFTETAAGDMVLNYQGRLTNPATGLALPDGNYTVQFSIYDAATAGSELWTETLTVHPDHGVFQVLLGDSSTLPDYFFDGRRLWLQLKVGTETLTPRQRIAWVAYAFHAFRADFVRENSISTEYIVDGEVTTDDIEDLQRTVVVPSAALSYLHADVAMNEESYGEAGAGLKIPANNLTGTYAYTARPEDWAGSDVTPTLYYFPAATSFTAGTISFYIRATSLDGGITLNSTPAAILSGGQAVTGNFQLREQNFTIPADRLFGGLWSVQLLRDGAGENFTGDVAVMAVKFTYDATR